MTKQESLLTREQEDQLRRRIIELIHGCEYEEAVKRENNSLYCNHCNRKDNFRMSENKTSFFVYCANCEHKTEYVERQRHPGQRDEELAKIGHRKPLPITLGRLLKAIHVKYGSVAAVDKDGMYQIHIPDRDMVIPWLLTLPNGQESHYDYQTQETKNALYNLLCNADT